MKSHKKPTLLYDQVFSPIANSSVALSHNIDLQITSPPQAPKFQVRSDVYIRAPVPATQRVLVLGRREKSDLQ